MARLAIKGHATRGKEVIGLPEMLGGKNSDVSGENIYAVYSIPNNGYIYPYLYAHKKYPDDFIIFTLEEFLEKYPYKVGDKVQHRWATSCGSIYDIEQMKWEDNQVKYIICDLYWKNCKCTVTSKDLQPYKEETMEEKGTLTQIDLTRELCVADEVEVILGDYEFMLKDGKTYFVKKKPQYPKTYEECCKVMGIDVSRKFIYEEIPFYNEITLYEENIKKQLEALRKLLICRDAYWKIAGEQMGLDEPWKPDYGNDCDTKYIITVARNEIYKDVSVIFNYFLIFPTEEMQNAFHENFKELIEECKEFL